MRLNENFYENGKRGLGHFPIVNMKMKETSSRTMNPLATVMKNGESERKSLRISFTLCIFLSVTHLFCLVSHAQALDASQCNSPLGMKTHEIPDKDLTASSSFDQFVGPQNGRVFVERQGGAWCPKGTITSKAEEWLQIDLHTVHVITATETQGRFGNGIGREYADAYVLTYWRPELNKWVRYRDHTGNESLQGNTNTYISQKTELNPPIMASKLRILPYSIHGRLVCLRAEIYGCPFRRGLLSYNMPQGSQRGENWTLYDHTYDGIWDGNYLRNGVGQLTDGRGGPENFMEDFYEHERNRGWVGWTNETKNGSNPIEILFKFDSVREFSAVYIHTSNQFQADIQIFSKARVFFSVGGKMYPGDPISYTPIEDCISEEPKNVTIKLHHRIGQYVKLQLFFATKWILISELTFDSQPARGNSDEALVPTEDASMAQSDASEAVPAFLALVLILIFLILL